MEEAYIDSSVFIYAATSTSEEGKAATKILEDIVSGKIRAFTSVLTFDEVFWKVKKLSSTEDALKMTKSFLTFPNLVFLEAKLETIAVAHDIIGKYKLDPRDAIHSATCHTNNIRAIFSDDSDFDKVGFLKRKSIRKK